MVEKNKKTAPEIIRFQGLWSEMGDSNSRHLAPKASALPTALIPDFWLLSFAPDVVKHVVRRFFWPSRLAGEVPVSQAYQGIADTVFSGLKGEHPAPKPGAIPTSLYPDIQFLPLYYGGGENQRFFCLWSFMWSKPLLCRFLQPGKIPQTQVSQGFAAFHLAPSRIPPQRSQSRRGTNSAIPGYFPHRPSELWTGDMGFFSIVYFWNNCKSYVSVIR